MHIKADKIEIGLFTKNAFAFPLFPPSSTVLLVTENPEAFQREQMGLIYKLQEKCVFPKPL